MLKQLMLSAFVLSSTNTYAMYYSLDSALCIRSYFNVLVNSYTPSWLRWNDTNPKTQPIKNIRTDIELFKAQLPIHSCWLPKEYLIPELGLFTIEDIHNDPKKFLSYSYYQEFHRTEIDMFQQFNTDHEFLTLCKNARINGYSALGAAMFAEEVSYEDILIFIDKLKSHGFTPTEKDKNIVRLRLYEKINTKHKKVIPLLLGNGKHNNFAQLLPEINHIIMRYLIDSKKIAYSQKIYPSS